MQSLEHSSREIPEGLADPEMIFYRTLIVRSPDVADVVKDICFLKRLAMDVDFRLQPHLLSRVDGYKKSLASLSSVNGQMLNKLSTTTTAYHYLEKGSKQKQSLKDVISSLPKEDKED